MDEICTRLETNKRNTVKININMFWTEIVVIGAYRPNENSPNMEEENFIESVQ